MSPSSPSPMSQMMLAVLDHCDDPELTERFMAANTDSRFRAGLASSARVPGWVHLQLMGESDPFVKRAAIVAMFASVLDDASGGVDVTARFETLRAVVAAESDMSVLTALLDEMAYDATSWPPAAFLLADECLRRLVWCVENPSPFLSSAELVDDLSVAASVVGCMGGYVDVESFATVSWRAFSPDASNIVPPRLMNLWSEVTASNVDWLLDLRSATAATGDGAAASATVTAVAASAVSRTADGSKAWGLVEVLCEHLVLQPLRAAVAASLLSGASDTVPADVVAGLETVADMLFCAAPRPACATGRRVLDATACAFEPFVVPALSQTIKELRDSSTLSPDMSFDDLEVFVERMDRRDSAAVLGVLRHPACSPSIAFEMFSQLPAAAVFAEVPSMRPPIAAAAVCWSPVVLEVMDPAVRPHVALRVLSSSTMLGQLRVHDSDSVAAACVVAAAAGPDMFSELPCSLAYELSEIPMVREWVAGMLAGLSPAQLSMASAFAATGAADQMSFGDLLSTVVSLADAAAQ